MEIGEKGVYQGYYAEVDGGLSGEKADEDNSGWKKVTNRIPQGSVLAHLMFLIHINDLGEEVNSYISKFIDDAKTLMQINENSSTALKDDLNKIYAWSQKWQVDFNTNKGSM